MYISTAAIYISTVAIYRNHGTKLSQNGGVKRLRISARRWERRGATSQLRSAAGRAVRRRDAP